MRTLYRSSEHLFFHAAYTRRGHNGRVHEDGRVRILSPSPSEEETAAIVAAVEHFVRATALQPAATPAPANPWRRAALLEGVMRDAPTDLREPWING
jgi:hypothetical protein